MTFARNLIRDLVAKRLWPLALLLLAAIVAIPLAFGGGGAASPPNDVPAVAPTPAAAPAAVPIELVGPASVRSRGGKLVDPFRRAPAKSDVAPTTNSSSGGGASNGDATSTPGNTGRPASPPVQSHDPTPGSRSVYRTTVNWSPGEPPQKRRIARLTPLGAVVNPALLYLGVAPDGKHAIFLLGPDATFRGDAGCLDAKCRIIALRGGQSQIVDLKPEGGEPRRFELDVVSVKRDDLTSASNAAKSRAKEHPDGRDVLRSLIRHRPTADVIGGYAYDTDRGVLIRTGDEPAKETG